MDGCIFSIKYSHHHVVVPLAVHIGSFALAPFDAEAALLVRADRSPIVVDDTHREAMQAKLLKGVSLYEHDGLAVPSPFPKRAGSSIPIAKPRLAISKIDTVQADVPYY